MNSPGMVRQMDRLRVLAETTQAFAEATTDIKRLLTCVAERVAGVIGDGCYVRLVAADGLTLVPVATYHPDPDTQRYLRETTDQVSLEIGQGISGKVVATGTSVLVPEVSFETYRALTKPEFVPHFARIGISSLMVVPLGARGARFGFLAAVRNGVGRPAYAPEDLQLLEDLAARAAMAIDNARMLEGLEEQVSARTREIGFANAELDAFTHSVSHDLRAPLRAIVGFSEILEEDHGAGLDDDGRRVLRIIRRNALQMGCLIDDLLRFSRLGRQSLAVRPVDMNALVREVVAETLEQAPGRTIEVRVGELPSAPADRALLRQVWTNLIGNAVKYTRPRAVAVIEIDGAIEGSDVGFRVKDNGVGFDPRYTHKLFGVFERLHAATEFEGTGVGLALVQRIVTRHGGHVQAEGAVGVGATVGFTLPMGNT